MKNPQEIPLTGFIRLPKLELFRENFQRCPNIAVYSKHKQVNIEAEPNVQLLLGLNPGPESVFFT